MRIHNPPPELGWRGVARGQCENSLYPNFIMIAIIFVKPEFLFQKYSSFRPESKQLLERFSLSKDSYINHIETFGI